MPRNSHDGLSTALLGWRAIPPAWGADFFLLGPLESYRAQPLRLNSGADLQDSLFKSPHYRNRGQGVQDFFPTQLPPLPPVHGVFISEQLTRCEKGQH